MQIVLKTAVPVVLAKIIQKGVFHSRQSSLRENRIRPRAIEEEAIVPVLHTEHQQQTIAVRAEAKLIGMVIRHRGIECIGAVIGGFGIFQCQQVEAAAVCLGNAYPLLCTASRAVRSSAGRPGHQSGKSGRSIQSTVPAHSGCPAHTPPKQAA